MKDKFVRLEFAVKFSQMDLQHLRASEWLMLRENINEFMGLTHNATDLPSPDSKDYSTHRIDIESSDVVIAHELPLPETFPINKLEKVRDDLYQRLLPFAEANSNEMFDTNEEFKALPCLIKAQYFLIPFYKLNKPPREPLVGIEYGKSPLIAVVGLVDGFTLITLQLLRDYGASLRCCRDCKRIFIAKDKRKVFCSKLCVNREVVRNWRKKNTQKVSDKNHKHYVRRVHKKSGFKIKVDRRPRKTRGV